MEAEGLENELSRVMSVLASSTRVALLHRLERPAFAPDLAEEFAITRQALKKHLDALEGVGLVVTQPGRRGLMRATEYATSPQGLFTFKEAVQSLAVTTDPSVLPPAVTVAAEEEGRLQAGSGTGLMMIYGDTPGRWFSLVGKTEWVVGRDADAHIVLGYDSFASARHTMLRNGASGWSITDIRSTNGTRLNFRFIRPGEPTPLRHGDLVTIGRSHLLFRDGA